MQTEVTINLPYASYLIYMESKHLFRGTHNMRKVCIFLALFKQPHNRRLRAREIWLKAGYDHPFVTIRSALSRLTKYKYILRNDNGYKLSKKGLRFLYAASQLAPDYKAWCNYVD